MVREMEKREFILFWDVWLRMLMVDFDFLCVLLFGREVNELLKIYF